MKTIWKYEVAPGFGTVYRMPVGAKVLSVHTQHGVPNVWVLIDDVDPNSCQREVRTLTAYGTGQKIPDNPGTFIGTFMMGGESMVWHLFEQTN